MQSAFNLDSIRNSHPIEVPVRDALEVDQIFDHISYLKGSSVIRMLSAHLGTETFLLGVSNYLKAHEYSNARTDDLWTALSEASKQDINTFMDSWIQKIGFPVVTIAEEPGQISARQSRFLISGDVEAKDDDTVWWIPLGLKTGTNAAGEVTALTAKTDTIRNIDDSFYKINVDQTGFYRTNYPPERLKQLGKARKDLSIQDRIGLVGDAAALAQSGDGTTAAFLALSELFVDEEQYLVWQQIVVSLNNVKSIFAEYEDVSEGLRKYTLKLITPTVEKLGWEFAPDEDLLTGRLRALLISNAGTAGHETIVAEAKRRFNAYMAGDTSAIHASLRVPVFRIAVRKGGETEYDAVKKFYSTTTSIDGKEIALQSLGGVPTAELAKDLLAFNFSPAVAVQDRHSIGVALASNSKFRIVHWEYIKENWESTIFPELSGNMVVLERYLRSGLSKFASFEVEKDIHDFFADKDQRGFDRGLTVVQDMIHGAAKYKERDVELVREWLKANGY
jgi:aminopeptidase N